MIVTDASSAHTLWAHAAVIQVTGVCVCTCGSFSGMEAKWVQTGQECEECCFLVASECVPALVPDKSLSALFCRSFGLWLDFGSSSFLSFSSHTYNIINKET